MVRINKQVLKSVSVPVLWGGLWLCEALGFVFMLKEWRDYPLWCDLMLTETFRMDALRQAPVCFLYLHVLPFGVDRSGFLRFPVPLFEISQVGRKSSFRREYERGVALCSLCVTC